MKKNIFIIICVIFLVVIELSGAALFSIHPDIVLMAIMAATLVLRFQIVLPWVVVTGIIFDLFSYQAVGISVILFVLFSYGTSFFSRRFLVGGRGISFFTTIFLVLGATLLFNVCLSFIETWSLRVVALRSGIVSLTVMSIICNLLVFLLFFWIVKRIRNIFYPGEYKLDVS